MPCDGVVHCVLFVFASVCYVRDRTGHCSGEDVVNKRGEPDLGLDYS